MANPTTNLSITLPEPASESSRGTWGTTINDAIQSLDTGIADRGVPSGGTDDQVLTKNGTDDYATEWATRLSSVTVTGSDGIEVDSGSPLTANGTIALGVNKSTMLTFLNAEDGSTADQTGAEIKTAYQAESNAFTDAQFTKLAGIETSATADQTGAQIKTLYEAESNAFTDAQFTKLSGIETSATADQSASEILTAIEDGIDSVHYKDGSIDTVHVGANQITAAKVASDVATTTGSQTLTNKTLTSPVFTTPNVGTIGTGTWQGTPVADAYIASAATWNAKETAGTGVAMAIALG